MRKKVVDILRGRIRNKFSIIALWPSLTKLSFCRWQQSPKVNALSWKVTVKNFFILKHESFSRVELTIALKYGLRLVALLLLPAASMSTRPLWVHDVWVIRKNIYGGLPDSRDHLTVRFWDVDLQVWIQ